MATIKRHQYSQRTSEQLAAAVAKNAALWGMNEKEAREYLMDYALRRLDVLARNAAKKGPKAPKAKKKPLTKDEIAGRKARQKREREAKKAAAAKGAA